jgi:hypothetical protein
MILSNDTVTSGKLLEAKKAYGIVGADEIPF